MTAVLPEAPVRRAAPAPETAAPPAGPDLRVVDRYERPPATRRAHARLTALLLMLVVGAALFGLVTSHVALTQGQFRLDDLRQRADAEQDRYERLRLQVAELESPGRIVAAAQERLGMVPPPGVTYLSPVGPVADRHADDDGTSSTAAWSSVKRQLSRP